MMRNKKLIFGILVIIILAIVLIGLLLLSHEKPGKNIHNFYAMMDIANNNPSISDFDKMMNLCRDMENVPKKDKCFEYVAQTFAQIDMSKAKEACDEIKGFRDEVGHVVYTKEDCYSKIREGTNPIISIAKEHLQKYVYHAFHNVDFFSMVTKTEVVEGECEENHYWEGWGKPAIESPKKHQCYIVKFYYSSPCKGSYLAVYVDKNTDEVIGGTQTK